jgi:hypothetical protein
MGGGGSSFSSSEMGQIMPQLTSLANMFQSMQNSNSFSAAQAPQPRIGTGTASVSSQPMPQMNMNQMMANFGTQAQAAQQPQQPQLQNAALSLPTQGMNNDQLYQWYNQNEGKNILNAQGQQTAIPTGVGYSQMGQVQSWLNNPGGILNGAKL